MWAPVFGLRRPATLLEIVVAVIIIFLLIYVFIDKVRTALAHAEDSQIVATVNNLQSGLMQTALSALANGDLTRIAGLQTWNPMRLTRANPPANYRGELQGQAAMAIPTGYWYYDLQRQALVYRIAYPLAKATYGAETLYFKTRLRYLDRNDNAVFDPDTDSFTAIGLVRERD